MTAFILAHKAACTSQLLHEMSNVVGVHICLSKELHMSDSGVHEFLTVQTQEKQCSLFASLAPDGRLSLWDVLATNTRRRPQK